MTPHQLYIICEIYLNNVDAAFKILYAPSLRRYLQGGTAGLDCSPGPRGLEALELSISFAAILSMTDDECRHRIGENRVVLMAEYRAGNDTRRLMWTLTSLAVRIAQAMGLHLEKCSSSLRPFGREMRRRFWLQTCILDSYAAEDRATNPVVYVDSFSIKLPLRINDEDLHVDSYEEVEERQSFTDMTFCLICHEIMDTSRQLGYVSVKELDQHPVDFQERWTSRIDAVITL